MTIELHGSWICEEQPGYLFIWGETWRALGDDPDEAAPSLEHPYAADYRELNAFWRDRGLPLAELFADELLQQTRVLGLPTYVAADGEPLLPLLAGDRGATNGNETSSAIALHPWVVDGIRLRPGHALQLLDQLPLGGADRGYLGGDLRFWTHVNRWSLDLLVRCKFLPGVRARADLFAQGCWQPLLDSAIDQARLQQFIHAMPESCRVYTEPAPIDALDLLLNFLSAAVDARARAIAPRRIPPVRDPSLNRWLPSLTRASGSFALESQPFQRLHNALGTWTQPVQGYLGEQVLVTAQNPFRAALTLEPPQAGQGDWLLHFGLQALDNEQLVLPAETIWQHTGDELTIGNRTVLHPQEVLLKGLGVAGRIYAPVAASLDAAHPCSCRLDPIQAYEFVRAKAWQLEDNGISTLLPPGLAPGSGERRLGLKIRAGKPLERHSAGLGSPLNFDWELAVGDRSLSKSDFERLLAMQSPLVEVDGEWVALQPADVRAAQSMLASHNGDMQLSLADALRYGSGESQLLGKLPIVDFEASGALQRLFDNLGDSKALDEIAPPSALRGTLRPYQARGVSWLTFLEEWGLGACLADDMGLGKSIQALAFLLHLQENDGLDRPTLLICPTSVLGNWQREARRFAPSLRTLVHHGDKRSKGQAFIKAARSQDLVLTSYAIAQRDAKTIQKIRWRGTILDEAQNIKNPLSKQSQAVRQVDADFRIALTGTPIENRLSELWSILDFLNPGYLGSLQFFQKRFARPIEKYGDRDSLQILRSLVQPFILRRVKTDKSIIADLPEKEEANVYCGLSVEQATLYQTLVDTAMDEIDRAKGIERRGKILALLMKLKQLCNHPAHFLKEAAIEKPQRSGKLLRLTEMLEEIVAEGDRALIFTQFSEWGKLLKPFLEKQLNTEAMFLYGATRRDRREEMVERFQNDPSGPRIFILSLKAGGTGLNLTRANHVFHVDRWWNPAVENQATDRAFRIGQKRNVLVHKFVCTGTLEERIDDIIESKKHLAEQTVGDGEDWLTELDTEQLRDLVLLDRNTIIDEE
ncbi:superfamily II DNA/RNA helicase, SNF2 family [Rubidibacter lacunae KORDI 51-2]|uniref:Superfamily II DNA/RNA helicase, SNF2 family n=1 Tax=Rubidibacter lacunae KORDI 51-2 TaxID=582515 RepID=U5DFB9_9CHRO|nr:DEAD/DEAH box helicase [Rubidibacter lacunae]ERN43188.1 superfamily II DNA/RNA helicase, SNF2 family [Rubidibacter lacunae KORDI 51-2]